MPALGVLTLDKKPPAPVLSAVIAGERKPARVSTNDVVWPVIWALVTMVFVTALNRLTAYLVPEKTELVVVPFRLGPRVKLELQALGAFYAEVETQILAWMIVVVTLHCKFHAALATAERREELRKDA
jgi:hypothetical protein